MTWAESWNWVAENWRLLIVIWTVGALVNVGLIVAKQFVPD